MTANTFQRLFERQFQAKQQTKTQANTIEAKTYRNKHRNQHQSKYTGENSMPKATRTNSTKTRLLSGVGTTVIAALMAGGVHAAETTVADQNLIDPAATGNLTVNSPVTNIGEIIAAVAGAQGGQTVSGTQTGTTNTVTANIINANATANTFANALDLALIGDGAAPNVGAAALGVATNAADGATVGDVTASVTDSSLALDLTDFTSGTAVNSTNTIQAVATGNAGTTTLAGTIPNGYESDVGGSSAVNIDPTITTPPPNLFDAEGTVVASSVQANRNVGLVAVVEADGAGPGNSISLRLSSTFDNDVDSSPTLDSNTIDATMLGNTAASTIDIQAGGAPTFEGSAVLTNLQANENAIVGAFNESSTIAATVEGTTTPAPALNRLNGGLSVQGNTISSALVGNQAGSNGTAGNRILIGDAVSVTGPGVGAGTPGTSISYDSGNLISSAEADVLLKSSQGNDGGSLASTTQDGAVTAFARSLEGGSITLDRNTVSSQLTGNSASNALASGANAASFDAVVAVSSQQINNGVAGGLSATTSGAEIAAVVAPGIAPDGGRTSDSAVSVSRNTTTARGTGNDGTQTVALAANTLNAATGTPGNVELTGGTTGTNNDGNVSAEGNVTLANLQSNYSSALTVANTDSVVGLSADSRDAGANIANSTLAADLNTQEAVALGNRGTNALSLDGNTVGGGAGIASVQIVDDGSDIASTLSGASAGAIAATHVEGSSLSVTGNTQQAIGYGGTAANTLSVDANSVDVVSLGGGVGVPLSDTGQPFHTGTGQPRLQAAFGVLSDQSLESAVTATASANVVGLEVEGDLIGSGAANDGNILMAAGQGLDATNRLALDAGTLADISGNNVVGHLLNTQAVEGAGADVSAIVASGNARVRTEGAAGTAARGAVVYSFVEDDLNGSTVSTSANTVQAVATGSGASNTLAVTGNTVDVAAGLPGLVFNTSGTQALINPNAFGLTNAQSGDGTVTASLAGDPGGTTTPSASIVTLLGAEGVGTGGATTPPTVQTIDGSSAVSANNVLTAEGTSNRASNAVSIAANDATTNSGLMNVQVTDANITTVIGAEGTPPTAAFDFGYDITVQPGSSIFYDGTTGPSGSGDITAGTLEIARAGLSPEAIAYLVGEGWTDSGSGPLTFVASVGNPLSVTAPEGSSLTAGNPVSRNASVPASAGTPATGGVRIATFGNDIANSTLSVANNRVNGAVTGNSAANALSVEAATIAGTTGTDAPDSTVAAAGLALMAVSDVDHALVSEQQVSTDATADALESTVYGAFTVDTPALDIANGDNVAISGTTLDVTGNSVRATAVGNVGDNALDLEGNAIEAGSALLSRQGGDAAISATAGMDVRAPAAVASSSVDMSSNTNTALGVLNDATNAATVSGGSVSTLAAPANADLAFAAGSSPLLAVADHLVQNVQTAETSVTSTATTSIANNEAAAEATTGLVDSTLVASGNATYSEASANRATNSLALNGASSLTANGGVSNLQASEAAVEATATSNVALTLVGTVENTGATPAINAAGALSGSTVTMEGNSTEALARGNRAVNTLEAVAGAGYATAQAPDAGSGIVSTGPQLAVDATYAALNVQVNEGAVSAGSENAVYRIALNADTNATGGSANVTNGTVSLRGNSVTAQALGNSAVNRVSLVGLNTGSPTAAIGSSQTNTAGITSTVTSATMALASTGLSATSGVGSVNPVTGSSFALTGNSVSASATGNSVSNAIARVSR